MEPQCNNTSNKAEIPFVPFLAGLTAWPLLKIVAEAAVRHYNPEFYEDLKLDIRKGYNVYFGTLLGGIFKMVSIVACTAALFTTSAETDILGLARPLNTAEQWCWGCRSVIYIQELPHYASIPELVIHHVLAIAATIGILTYNMPRRQMYIFCATLASEFVGTARRLLKMHGKMTPRLTWWFSVASAITILFFRVTGAFVALLWSLQGGSSSFSLFFNASGLTIYVVYMMRMSVLELDRSKMLVISLKQPAKVTIAEKWEVSVFSILTGCAILWSEISTLLLYEAHIAETHIISETELHSIAWVSLQAVAVGLLGAYITARLVRSSVSKPGLQEKALPRMCMQGGLAFASAALLLSPTLAGTVDRSAFLACSYLSFLLLDAVCQAGYHFAGVGLGTWRVPLSSATSGKQLDAPDEKTPQLDGVETIPPTMSLPLIASMLNIASYVSILAAYLGGHLCLSQAAFIAVGLQTIIRLQTRIQLDRRDPLAAGVDSTSRRRVMSVMLPYLLQVAGVIGCIAYAEYRATIPSPRVWRNAWTLVFILAEYTCAAAFVLNAADLVMQTLSRPAIAPSSQEKKTEEVTAGTDKNSKTEGGRRRSKLPSLRTITVFAALGLCLFMAAGPYLGIMPAEMTSVEQARDYAAAVGPKSALWTAASSWQFALSIVGVALLPVVAVQLSIRWGLDWWL
ncbi:hypothetical protein B0H63DRAFT_450663 [Podospora didyma]|uniref:Uncharacterized protein n=1 Tax=Podospora didyma TaxID=330526 RepID=A0AAE0TVQ3_9PEZI|nr:hypothetical protein B0H63DRAFT_450663 [Podospora didyma]